MIGGRRDRRAPLGGCDCYLLALDGLMRRWGQGRHVGVTQVEVDENFSFVVWRDAVERFASVQTILRARLRRGWWLGVPYWEMKDSPGVVSVQEHPAGTQLPTVIQDLLRGEWSGALRFDVVKNESGGVTVLMSWSHLLFDARGVELTLAEVARLAADPAASPESDSWAEPFGRRGPFLQRLKVVRTFVERYWQIRSRRVFSLGAPPAEASAMRFELCRFGLRESEAMKVRAQPVTGGIIALPWFLAVAMRAHAAVLARRGAVDGSLECAISVQGRKRGARGPIFQNQVSQLFFSRPLEAMADLSSLARDLQQQFSDMLRQKCDAAFVVMVDWMRRLPAFAYRRFVRREACGQIVSFYHAHTGNFLPGLNDLAGGRIHDGWHIPSVPQPPGTGLFFSERDGRLTAVVCWREGVWSDEERKIFKNLVKSDLLGADSVAG